MMIANEEQRAFAQSLRELLRERSPAGAARRLRDSRDPTGYDAALWRELVELGLPGAAIAEEHGGFGFGYLGLGMAMIEFGRTLCATPLLSSVVLAASLVELAASTKRQSELLPRIASAQLDIAVAFDESPHYAPCSMRVYAAPSAHGWRIDGRKTLVLDAHVADQLIIAVPVEGDAASFVLALLDAAHPGIEIRRRHLMDGRNYGDVLLEGVQVGEDTLLCAPGAGGAALETALDRASVCAAAEMFGSAEAVFEQTVEYLKVREQFGVPIGSFQALQHRCAKLFVELELCRSVVLDALQAIDDGATDLALRASHCKALTNDLLQNLSNEAVQMHGGIGVTDELDIGLYLKRTPVCRRLFGDSEYHRSRFATLSGF